MASPQITLTDPGEWLKQKGIAPTLGDVQLTDPGEWLKNASSNPIADTLAHQGLLESVWNVLKGTGNAAVEAFTPHSRQQKLAQVQHALDVADKYIHGTDTEKAAARDEMIANVPGGSTFIKAREGNLGGVAGDAIGMGLVGGALKAAGSDAAANAAANVATGVRVAAPDLAAGGARVLAGEVLAKVPGMEIPARFGMGYPGARQMGAGIQKGFAAARQAAADRAARAPIAEVLPPEAPPTPANTSVPPRALITQGDIIPEAPPDASYVRSVPAQYPEVEPHAGQPAAPQVNQQALDGMARQAQFPSFAEAPPEVQKAIQNYVEQTAAKPQLVAKQQAASKVDVGPVQNSIPVADQLSRELDAQIAAKKAANPQESAPVNSSSPPAKTRSLAQTEAAMAQKAPPPTEAPQSLYTSTGERKSPELRAAEITGANIEAKAARLADAFHKEGITAEDVGNMTKSDAQMMVDGLVAKGVLQKGELPPEQSLPLLIKNLKAMEKANGVQSTVPVEPSSALAKNAKALELAKKLREMMIEDETIK